MYSTTPSSSRPPRPFRSRLPWSANPHPRTLRESASWRSNLSSDAPAALKERKQMINVRKWIGVAAVAGFVTVTLGAQRKAAGAGGSGTAGTQQKAGTGGWHTYGGDKAFTRYSSLDQINRDNVKNLQFVWSRGAVDPLLTNKFPDV